MKKTQNLRTGLFLCMVMVGLCAYKSNKQPAEKLQQAFQTSAFFLQPEQTKKGSSAKAQPSPKKTAATGAKPGAAAKPALQIDPHEGEGLIAKSDCLVCHKVDTKFVGPAYIDVAQKYSSDKTALQTLTDKVIKGGTGVWGQVPMAPHPQLSREDAQKMVAYILTLKAK